MTPVPLARAVRCGAEEAGEAITGWLRAARMCAHHGIPVCSHGIQELHVSLVAAQGNAGWIEVHSFPTDEYTTRPLRLEGHLAVVPDTPAVGVVFDWDKLRAADILEE
ncbi:MAG TPA: enolase C-terminal domain-like protein [Acidobacteriaceae bacterium]|nr:enolase C-terminal domain-like protein [Acidobacteriaceae bacterium]